MGGQLDTEKGEQIDEWMDKDVEIKTDGWVDKEME